MVEKSAIISLQGYQYINCPRKQTVLRKSGGIGVYIKNELFDSVSHLESQSDLYYMDKNFKNVHQPRARFTYRCLLCTPSKFKIL